VDSEQVWNQVRERLVRETGGRWPPQAQQRMMGMSAPEWTRYMAEDLGVPMTPQAISEEVVARMIATYHERLPLLPGAVRAVERLAARWPLGLASSSNRELIEHVLAEAGMAARFAATVSSEEVARGKPSPDVYLEAARRLGVPAGRAAAVEDSSNGLLSAVAAGMRVIAIPNPHYPPSGEALARASLVLGSLEELTADAVAALAARAG
jgi:HAD superfamily hydrolase (TIGR01509 family)